MMSDEELSRAIADARAREEQHPHRVVAEERRREQGPFVACACGRTFVSATFGRASSSWRRHRQTEEARGE